MSASKQAAPAAVAESSILADSQPAQGSISVYVVFDDCKECVLEAKKTINPQLWQACAGPLVNLPTPGTHVVYFPQGHTEQVAASLKKDVDAQIPNYSNLPPKLICLLHSVTLLANPDTDEVYAQMVLQPVSTIDKEALIRSDLSLKSNKPHTDFFCKTLTASDTSTHGGFSVPRRAAEKIFPPLDFSMQPPAQELVAKDLHDNVWTFRHIYRGQPKRHLLTTGWSLFVSGKRLIAGDSVLFIRDEKQQLLLGIRRASRQPTNMSSSVLSSDSMHIGVLEAAANAATNNSIFTVFYNPRTSPSEFVIPLAKYYKAVNSYQISLGMRFRMMFETEESGTRRYIGTITGISDVDPIKWKNSQWRNIQVGWDEANTGEKCHRVSIWDIEPVTSPFYICPPLISSKRPRHIGMPDDDSSEMDSLFKRMMPWLHDDMFLRDSLSVPGINFAQWMNMPQNPVLNHSLQSAYVQSASGPVLASLAETGASQNYGLITSQFPQSNPPCGLQMPQQQLDQLTKVSTLNPCSTSHEQTPNLTQQSQNLVNRLPPSSHYVQPQNIFQNQFAPINGQAQGNISHLSNQQQLPPTLHNLGQITDRGNQQISSNQIQLQMMQRLQQQEQSLHFQQSVGIGHHVGQMESFQDQQRLVADMARNIHIPASVPQAVEMPQATITASTYPCVIKLPQQQHNVNDAVHSNGYVSSATQQLRSLQQPFAALIPELQFPMGFQGSSINQISGNGRIELSEVPEVGQSLSTNGLLPSCSTSKLNDKIISAAKSMKGVIPNGCMQNSEAVNSSSVIDAASSSNSLVRCSDNNSALMTSSFTEKNKNIAVLDNPMVLNSIQSPQMSYLGTPYLSTSVCQPQNIANVQQSLNAAYFGFQPMMDQGGTGIVDARNNVSFETNGGQNSVPLNHDPLLSQDMACLRKSKSPSEDILNDFEYSKDPHPEEPSSIVSQSYGVPDMTFNSIESTLSDNSFMAKPPFVPPPQQYQRMRTYTKVYKRGAVGRSIDVTSYSGYNDLKQDLARRFGIEGQLEDRYKVGWKLVYVDHENDVLLVGDDPWEEFVSCVRSIKILSPQEVQKMSQEGDVSNSLLLNNQACSSSDGGNV